MPHTNPKIALTIAGVLLLAFGSGLFWFIHYSPDTTSSNPTTTPTPTISVGISGIVSVVAGNCMPGVSTCVTTHPTRKVYVYKSLSNSDMDGTDLVPGAGTLVATTMSDTSGAYALSVPAGTYSVLVESQGKQYCNIFGENANEVCSVTVTNSNTKYDISDSSQSTY